ncbi:uncharacterized protein YvbT [Arthrobacter sp. Hiyo6]|nr:uncharacterized protein YvbT [Arthrobacter sp. Hiyo6]
MGHANAPLRKAGFPVTVPFSILDLATIGKGQTAAESFAGSVAMAQRAEELGYRRVWYAEHHNMSSIASSATSVLIAHVAAHTNSIRLGAGGVMLPNHSPLTIAEQFGTLETLHPGRIDLGLGRAPGSDQNTMRALRRDPMSADSFPQDVLELQGYLTGPTRIQGVEATPGKVPMCRYTSWAPLSSGPGWRPSSVCRTPSPHTSLPMPFRTPWQFTAANSGRPPSLRRRTSSPG